MLVYPAVAHTEHEKKRLFVAASLSSVRFRLPRLDLRSVKCLHAQLHVRRASAIPVELSR